jgi:hypothetical protein
MSVSSILNLLHELNKILLLLYYFIQRLQSIQL